MNTQNIEDVFTDYLKTPNTQYAILLNGSWGSGKTYFWKFGLKKIAEDNQFKTIYISLNGLSKIEALEYQLFLKLLPLIGRTENKLAKAAISLITNVANKASKTFLKIGIDEALKDIKIDTLNFSKHIICFDDLERCQIPIKETLGFINNYVEHKYLKTIILADEKKIDESVNEKEQITYNDIKEKVIGRSLNYEPDLKVVLPLLIKKYETSNVDFHQFLQPRKDNITAILIEYREVNLRIIAFYIDVLEKVFPFLKTIDQKYISEVILFSALISIEFKRGKLKPSDNSDPKDIQNIDEHYYSLYIAQTSKLKDEESEIKTKSYAIVFHEKYLKNRIKEYYFYPSIYAYILTGYFKTSDFEKELKERYPEVLSDEVVSFRKLLNYKFRELPNAEFKALTNKVLDYAKEGKYFIYDYVQIANFFLFFSDNNLIDKTNDEILSIIDEGLDIAKNQKKIYDRILENLLHFKNDNPKVEVVKLKIKQVHTEIKKEQHLKDSDEFIDTLVNKDEYLLTEIFQKHQFSKELLQYTDSEKLFKGIIATNNKQIFNFTELLIDRYKSMNIGEFLFVDYDCLKELKEKLETYISTNKQGQPREFLITTLIKALEDNCNHLFATKK